MTEQSGEYDNLSEAEFAELVEEALGEYAREWNVPLEDARSFESAGLLTMNKGVVVRLGGRTFQLTVVRSR